MEHHERTLRGHGGPLGIWEGNRRKGQEQKPWTIHERICAGQWVSRRKEMGGNGNMADVLALDQDGPQRTKIHNDETQLRQRESFFDIASTRVRA